MLGEPKRNSFSLLRAGSLICALRPENIRETLRARAEINSHFGASAGRADARRRDAVDVEHRRGAATKPIRALAAAPLRAAARRPAGFVAPSSHTAPGIARRSRLASGPAGQQQNVKLFLREPLAGGEPKRTPGILQLTNVPR